jgi:N-acetylneuraminate synthase
MKIGTVEIGPDQPCRIIAELGNAHNCDFDRALRIVEAVKGAGADVLKLQAYTPHELVTLRGDGPAPDPWGKQGWSMLRLYEQAQTPARWVPRLVNRCEDLGLPWFSSVFGLQSLALLEALGCPAYKLASLDYGSRTLLNLVRKTRKPLIRSCALEEAPRGDDTFLYCPAGYPQAKPALRNLANGYAGFSYHGTDPLVPTLAAGLGAQLIEVHVQLDDEPSELEAAVSLTITQLAGLVEAVRRTEVAVAC